MTPIIIKRYNNENKILQMYQADYNADNNIINDFTEIIDKIIIDIYLKDNIFLKYKKDGLNDEEKKVFVLRKRKEILKEISLKDFNLIEYTNSNETIFSMTSCVKCNCRGIHGKEYESWEKSILIVYIANTARKNRMILPNNYRHSF